jgi:nucleotide-binding universal stress UspA family protein
MAYSSIVACIDGADNNRSMLAVASDLALAHGAALCGLHVPMPVRLDPSVKRLVNSGIAEIMARHRREAIDAAHELFVSATQAAPDRVWEVVEIAEPEAMPAAIFRRARCADLAVVPQVGPGERISDRPGTLPERLVMEAGRPILIVPPALSLPTVGRRVLVAWNQSREAARALNDALPILAKAEQVWILTINERGLASVDYPDARAEWAVAYLGRHGITAQPLHDGTNEISASDILLSRLSDLSADLLVMGAYGHSRFRELVLGGVTREILAHMTVPVLMSH